MRRTRPFRLPHPPSFSLHPCISARVSLNRHLAFVNLSAGSTAPKRTGPSMKALIKFITEEWYFFLPMLMLSLVAAALVVWRWLLNVNAKTDMESFRPVFQDKLQKEGVESALKYCRVQNGIIPRKLFVAGLENSRQGLAAMKRAMANAIELEILPDLNFLLAPILAIAKVATMCGLLLTVFSMINTFSAISDTAKGGNVSSVTNHSAAIGLA